MLLIGQFCSWEALLAAQPYWQSRPCSPGRGPFLEEALQRRLCRKGRPEESICVLRARDTQCLPERCILPVPGSRRVSLVFSSYSSQEYPPVRSPDPDGRGASG